MGMQKVLSTIFAINTLAPPKGIRIILSKKAEVLKVQYEYSAI
jgi:hypothetical protein